MSFLKKRKLRKFGETARERNTTFFVFGSNIFAERFTNELIKLGLSERIALVSDEELLWTEEVDEEILVLYEKRESEYDKSLLYQSIGLDNAEKIIVLHESPSLIDKIVSHAINEAPKAKIIVLSRFAPPFIHYLASAHQEKIIIVDDITRVVFDLYKTFNFELSKPLIIQVPIKKKMIGVNPKDYTVDKCTFLKILREIESKNKIQEKLFSVNSVLEEGDELMVYLGDLEALSNLVSFFDSY